MGFVVYSPTVGLRLYVVVRVEQRSMAGAETERERRGSHAVQVVHSVCRIFDIALTGAFSASGFNGLLRASNASCFPSLPLD